MLAATPVANDVSGQGLVGRDGGGNGGWERDGGWEREREGQKEGEEEGFVEKEEGVEAEWEGDGRQEGEGERFVEKERAVDVGWKGGGREEGQGGGERWEGGGAATGRLSLKGPVMDLLTPFTAEGDVDFAAFGHYLQV